MGSIKKLILDLLFPPKCVSCGEAAQKDSPLCRRCYDKYVSELAQRCPVCGRVPSECSCKSSLDGVFITFYRGYNGVGGSVTSSCIYHLKHHKNETLADFFARDIAHRLLKRTVLDGKGTDDYVLTYIPRSEKNLEKYGFDHGKLLCERVSYYTGIPMAEMFYRSGGEEQKKMNRAERIKNAGSTVDVIGGIDVLGKHVILVDDVTTTGATLTRAAELLLPRGAAEVSSAVIARTAWR